MAIRVRVYEENEYSDDIETVNITTNTEEIEELLSSVDFKAGSGNNWGDHAYAECMIRVVWGGKFDKNLKLWCSIADLEKAGWFFAVDEENKIVIATNPQEKDYELNYDDFGWFKKLEEF